jgi:hypothetical protein
MPRKGKQVSVQLPDPILRAYERLAKADDRPLATYLARVLTQLVRGEKVELEVEE